MGARFKWVGRWDPTEWQLRLFRVMWETYDKGHDPVRCWSHKVSVSIKHFIPWVTFRRCSGGRFV